MRPTPGVQATADDEFIDASRTLLSQDYQPRLLACLDALSEEDIWWRPNEASNSVGNMLLHVCGNLREWIIGGVGGKPFERDRPEEFRARGSHPKDELIGQLQETLNRVDGVLADVREDTLLDRIKIQEFEVTRLHAVYHAVEHFSYHFGQIAYVAKLKTGRDLGFYP